MAQGTGTQRKIRKAMSRRNNKEVQAVSSTALVKELGLRDAMNGQQFHEAVSRMPDYVVVSSLNDAGQRVCVLRKVG